MKKINFKLNIISYIYIITIVLMFGLFIFEFYAEYLDDITYEKNHLKEYRKICTIYVNSGDKEKEELKKEYLYLDDIFCNLKLSYNKISNSAIDNYFDLIEFKSSRFIVPFFVPILVVFPAIYLVTKNFKTGYVKNYLLRDNYKNYIKKILKMAYKDVWIFPLMFVLTFFICFIITGHNDYRVSAAYSYIMNQEIYGDIMFYVLYIVVLFLNYLSCINIGLISISNNKNFIFSILKSFLLIYFYWIFSEIFFSRLAKFLNISYGNFSLLNMYTWINVTNIYLYAFINLIIFLLSLIMVYFKFKNKEKIVMLCEK